jgi:hypothetical protein
MIAAYFHCNEKKRTRLNKPKQKLLESGSSIHYLDGLMSYSYEK